jgi:hypothetical protein
MYRRLPALAAVLLLIAVIPHHALHAQPAVDPAIFVLEPADFPAGSQIVTSEIADDVTLALQHLQLGPPAPANRVTGYYMQARIANASGGIGAVLSFLASIYPDAGSAGSAFQQQDTYWKGLLHQAPSTVDIYTITSPVGDQGQSRWYGFHDVNQNTHAELFFQRGSFFLEVNIDVFARSLSGDDMSAAQHVAGALDTIAVLGRSRNTPTATGTATSTPTATGTPTATPTRTPIPPTATPTLPKPIQESTSPPKPAKCKKGYKRVKGKCKKK